MASTATSGDGTRTSPGNHAENSSLPSRRGVVAALAGAAALSVAVPLAAAAQTGARSAARVRWDRARATCEVADETLNTFYREVHNPAIDELMRRAPRPELAFTVTAKNGQQATHYPRVDELDDYAALPWCRREAGALRDAWHDFVRRRDEWERRLDIEAINRRENELVEAWQKAESALFALPSPDAEALAYKVRLALQHSASVLDEHREALLADASRLLDISTETR